MDQTRWESWRGIPIKDWLRWSYTVIRITPQESLDVVCALGPPVRFYEEDIWKIELDGHLKEIINNGKHSVATVQPVIGKEIKIKLGSKITIYTPKL